MRPRRSPSERLSRTTRWNTSCVGVPPRRRIAVSTSGCVHIRVSAGETRVDCLKTAPADTPTGMWKGVRHEDAGRHRDREHRGASTDADAQSAPRSRGVFALPDRRSRSPKARHVRAASAADQGRIWMGARRTRSRPSGGAACERPRPHATAAGVVVGRCTASMCSRIACDHERERRHRTEGHQLGLVSGYGDLEGGRSLDIARGGSTDATDGIGRPPAPPGGWSADGS